MRRVDRSALRRTAAPALRAARQAHEDPLIMRQRFSLGLFLLTVTMALLALGAATAPRKSAPHKPRDAAPRAGPEPTAAASEPEETTWPSCAEHVPSGAARPKMQESFPARALSGYAAALEVTIEHGNGEKVLPEGFRVQSGSDAARALGEAGFVLPHADGGAGPSLTTTAGSANATTK